MLTFGAYIQVPFCQTKCTYCNFHTGVVSRDRYEPYAAAVCREVSESAGPPGQQAIDTIYFGGGTPSLLAPTALARILDALRESYRVESLETTLEADPETISPIKAAAWLDSGFNRISLGVQSFDDRELQATGRMHRREDIFRAVEVLRAAGFRNISMDLIAGLPHQTRESWDRNVGELLRLYPEHVSIYMLEVDEGSRLGKEALEGGSRYSADAIPSDDAQADFYESACARLAAAGYNHYEISNWGLPGRESLHNLKYWRREPYLGFGAGAHSFDGTARWANIHDPARYVTCIERGTSTRELLETLSPMHALHEEFFLGLRRLEGIDLARIERELDPDPVLATRLATLHQRIEMLQSHGMLDFEGGRLRIPANRLTISNEVFLELLG
ncbi:MAG TPA: radical SAM family heme chaperone HemW [Candidatus Acidoferrales bacterium]|jgi:oxygen-independent coproporphyrinogen-3 oxidase|nr:radical SAM family heme chaperone HemW [Candidatus Acidoferrales bacterium]